MTAISERIAQAHKYAPDYIAPYRLVVCSCDGYETSRDAVAHTRHIAEVTEAATRESIRVKLRDLPTTRTLAYLKGWDSISLNDAIGSTL